MPNKTTNQVKPNTPSQPTNSNKLNKPREIVNTADNENLRLWLGLMILSICAIVLDIELRRRNT